MVTLVPARRLVPLVLSIALIGSWAIDQTIENAVVTAVFAVIGYAMSRLGYPRLPIVIALVLGSGVERSFHQSMAMSDGSWGVFVTRPICLVLLTCLALALLATPLRSFLRRAFLRAPLPARGAA